MRIAVDSSALLAILLDEPDASEFLSKLLIATTVSISPVNWWEVQVRMSHRYGHAGAARSAEWMEEVGVNIQPLTAVQARIAVEAFERYHGRPARLNLGDCFAYALAKDKDVPLLYRGDDFTPTDVKRI